MLTCKFYNPDRIYEINKRGQENVKKENKENYNYGYSLTSSLF